MRYSEAQSNEPQQTSFERTEVDYELCTETVAKKTLHKFLNKTSAQDTVGVSADSSL